MPRKPAIPLVRDLADVRTVGIPRGLLYYRYGDLWRTFFEELGRTVIVSKKTDKALVDAGSAVSVDECCLASKAYMGHAESLLDRCDALFVPCYASGDARSGFCTKFQSLPDLVRSTFRDRDVRIMSLLVEDASNKKTTQRAFTELALRMGATPTTAQRAWKAALHAQDAHDAKYAAAQEETLRQLDKRRSLADAAASAGTSASAKANARGSADANANVSADVSANASATSNAKPRPQRPLSILLVAHPYISHDPYLSGSIIEALERMDATVLFADETNHAKARKASFDFSHTLPWAISRELVGSILLLRDRIDGIVLVSAFPCGPDSMTDDAIMRCIQGKPILNLMIDAQSGTAGIETRVESFIDILKFQQKGGYVNG